MIWALLIHNRLKFIFLLFMRQLNKKNKQTQNQYVLVFYLIKKTPLFKEKHNKKSSHPSLPHLYNVI